jgi:hypothetical protein
MSLAATIWFFYYVFAEFITGIVRCAVDERRNKDVLK